MDSTFGADGIVTTNFSTDDYADYIRDLAIQPDGRLVAAGNSEEYIAMARYNANGTLDNTFGTNGTIKLMLNGVNADAMVIALQSDGKMILTGEMSPQGVSGDKIFLLRLETGGTIDSSFGNNGYVTTSSNCTSSGAFDLALHDEKIYVAAGLETLVHGQFSIIRYLNSECLLFSNFSSTVSGLTISLTDQSSNALSWFWDFGDGNTSTLQSPQHTYVNEGTYSVCLTITDTCGSHTSCQTISVCDPLNTDFLYQLNELTIQMANQITEATSFFWDFGDGSTSTQQNPVHDFPSAGTYHVCLTEWDECASDTICKDITIIATGMAGAIQDLHITAFPNPTTGLLTVSYKLTEPSLVTLQLTDLTGKSIESFISGKISAGMYEKQLNLQGCDAGIYLLQFQINSQTRFLKIVVQ